MHTVVAKTRLPVEIYIAAIELLPFNFNYTIFKIVLFAILYSRDLMQNKESTVSLAFKTKPTSTKRSYHTGIIMTWLSYDIVALFLLHFIFTIF